MIRVATLDDAASIAAIFHATVKAVNSRDYTEAQIMAWAGDSPDPGKWRARQATRKTFVFEVAGVVRGFAEFKENGHIDAVYVHADHLGKGVASALLVRIEQEAKNLGLARVYTEASITARPFFAKRGFESLSSQEVEYRGCRFTNFKMSKAIPSQSPDPTPPSRHGAA